MKLSLVATTIFTLTLGFYTPKVTAAPIKTPKTFKEWCQQKASLPQETKRTVEALLKVAKTRNCSQANQTLTKLTSLYLSGNQISDIKPLSNLTNLTSLSLSENKISDIKPLSNLTNLTTLYLGGNKISDIKPLSNLTNLTTLYLWVNKISDIKPLSNLTKLTSLSLLFNQISDIKPLSNLTNLTFLNLAKNPLIVKQCPLKPESICKF
jgi:internalin A